VGRRGHRAFLARLAVDPCAAEASRARLLYGWVRMGWAAAIATVLVVWALPGLDPVDLGLGAPDPLRLLPEGSGAVLAGAIVGAIVAILAGLAVGTLFMRTAGRPRGQSVQARPRGQSVQARPRGQSVQARPRGQSVQTRRTGRAFGPAAQSVTPMLPTGRRDRRAWVLLSVTAGITEEITYRGLTLLAVAVAVPVGRVPAMVIVAALFGLAHAYQGIGGVAVTALAGGLLAGIYLATGSLVPGMVLHALIDLRALLLRPARPSNQPVDQSSHQPSEAAALPQPTLAMPR
jgi:membrane protease YdiL (CAAX protease family)